MWLLCGLEILVFVVHLLVHVNGKARVCLLQSGESCQHHSKGQQSLHIQHGGWWVCIFRYYIEEFGEQTWC